MGLQGPAGSAGSTSQIIVCLWGEYLPAVGAIFAQYNPDTREFGDYDLLGILGAGFEPGDTVTLTICDENCYWASATADNCGAFWVEVDLTDLNSEQMYNLYINYIAEELAVSVRAWVGATVYDDPTDDPDMGSKVTAGALRAVWPLIIATD